MNTYTKVAFWLLVVGALCGTAEATTLYVNETGWYRSGDAFNATGTPIQHAVDNASSYDTVYIWNGSYTENIDITTHNLTIQGEGRDVVNITAASFGDDVFGVAANYTNIIGVNVSGAWAGGESGIYIGIGVNNCNISFNKAIGNYYGIYLRTATDNMLISNIATKNDAFGINLYDFSTGNNLTGNNASDTVAGISLHESCNNVLTDNIANSNSGTGISLLTCTNDSILTNNTANSNGYGITISTDSVNNTLTSNNASNNNHRGISIHFSCSNTTLTSNNASSNLEHGIHAWSSSNSTFTDNIASSNNQYGIYLHSSNDCIFTNNIASNNGYGTILRFSSNNIFNQHNSTNSSSYDYYAWYTSINNTLLNCNLSSAASMMNDSTSQWIIKYTDGRVIDTNDPALSMTCYAGNCTLALQPTELNYTINMTTLDVTVSAATGSVSVSANSTLVNIDYVNSTINDLNITALDRQLILESAGVQTMIFDPTNIFNLWNFEYYINATANRKAVAFNTYCTNATNLINFTFYDLYPSSNFDCKYNSSSFTTNTSGTTGTLEFNKSTWDAGVTRTVEIYMTTTPYSCGDGVCVVDEGDPMMLYLALNDTTVTHVRAEITQPNGNKANHNMTDFLQDGATSWYINYADTGASGTYTANNFYSSKDGSTWKQLDSFLTFTSRAVSGGGGGGGVGLPDTEEPVLEVPAGAAGAGATPPPPPEPEPEEHAIKPAKQFTSTMIGGIASFEGSHIINIESTQSGTVQIDEYKLNPTTTSLIGGTRYGYIDIIVPNPNIGGTVCFATPPGLANTLGIYQLDNNEWMELDTTKTEDAWCVDVGHFSYFALADPGMESVIESLTQLSFSPAKVEGILVWKWLKNKYTSKHVANRELANISTSEGMSCEILTIGDYPNRTLKCIYTPPAGADWHSQKYTGEVIAVDTEGYTRRIPVSILVYNMDKLGFPLFIGVVLIGGVVLYRRYD